MARCSLNADLRTKQDGWHTAGGSGNSEMRQRRGIFPEEAPTHPATPAALTPPELGQSWFTLPRGFQLPAPKCLLRHGDLCSWRTSVRSMTLLTKVSTITKPSSQQTSTAQRTYYTAGQTARDQRDERTWSLQLFLGCQIL